MKRSTILLSAVALVALAFAALPALASAESTDTFPTTPKLALSATGANVGKFTSTGGAATLTAEGLPTIHCTSVTNEGTLETPFSEAMTGHVTIKFHECRESALNSRCTSSGAAAGEIVTTSLPFHLLYLKSRNPETNPHETPGILITSAAEEHFASFVCAGGLATVKVTGNGILGRVTSPVNGEEATSLILSVAGTTTVQEFTKTTENEKEWHLEASENGGAMHNAVENAEPDTITLTEGEGTTSPGTFPTTPKLALSATGANAGKFTSTGGAAELNAEGLPTIHCTSVTNEGTLETPFSEAMTGHVTIKFHECRESALNSRCTSSGAAAGEIVTTSLPFHLLYLKSRNPSTNPHETPGILITSAAEKHFATFTCVGGALSVKVTGNGILGRVTSPGIGETLSSLSLSVQANEAGEQEFKKTTESETEWHLEASENGGAMHSAVENAEPDTITLTEGTGTTNT